MDLENYKGSGRRVYEELVQCFAKRHTLSLERHSRLISGAAKRVLSSASESIAFAKVLGPSRNGPNVGLSS